MNAQFVYSEQSVAPILVQEDVLGTVSPIVVRGFEGRICMPILGANRPGSDFREVEPPESFDVGILPKVHPREWPWDWGTQVRLPSGECTIGRFLFEFELADEEEAARDQITRIERSIHQWFGILRDWIEVLTTQDLSTNETFRDPREYQSHLWSWNDGTAWRQTQAGVQGGMVVVMRDYSTAVSSSTWQRALAQANQQLRPPDPFLLLRDARARLMRQQFNYSVIYSAIAAEVVIRDRVEAAMSGLGIPSSYVERVIGRTTLGALVDLSKDFQVALPPGFQEGVTKVRNNAMHKNVQIPREQARKVLDLASDVLAQHLPLD